MGNPQPGGSGDAALARLARLKLRGTVRKQLRRLNRPANVLFAVLGLLLMVGWLSVLVFRGGGGSSALAADELRDLICATGLILVGMTMTSSLSHRGLYLPPAEMELLLSAPVSRTALVRYRVFSSTGRALFGALIVGLMAGRHMPRPLFGFLGAFLATLVLPTIGQGVSLLAGSAENRFTDRVARLPFRWINLGLVFVFVFTALAATGDGAFGSRLRAVGLDGGYQDLLRHPWLVTVGAPLRPWARLMTAASLPAFAGWCAACVALHAALFELVARVPIDFRELSLSTSADVARRLRRFNRGGSGSSTWEVSRRAAGRRIPWLFGRGAFGAVAWRKTAAILRKARGTLFTGVLIVGMLTVFSGMLESVSSPEAPPGLIGALMIALVGTIYLCAGLRYDFREELDQLGVIKSWPLASWKLFLATILPEIVLVTTFVSVGIVLATVASGAWHPAPIAVLGAVPLIVTVWTAIDNVVFLCAPVRFTPGQEGALHHAGRAVLLMLLRVVTFGVVGFCLAVALLAVFLVEELVGLPEWGFELLAVVLGSATLLLLIGLLVALGGVVLRRFDVARHAR